MTIKELKNNLLLALYQRYKDNKIGPIQLTALCKQFGLIYDTPQQLLMTAKSLYNSGYIGATFLGGGEAIIRSFPAKGIEYVEENLLPKENLLIDGLNGTSNLVNPTKLDVDDGTNSQLTKKDEENNHKPSQSFKPRENIKPFKDLDVEPCFSVDELADCFIKQLDAIGKSTIESTPMIGVFAPWGRGKSYFLEHVFKQLETRHRPKKYKIIKFNAWKYQDTPAIWAYLFETIYKHTAWWQKFLIYLTKRIYSYKFWIFILLIFVVWISGFLLKEYTAIFNKINDLKTIGGIGTFIAIIWSFSLTLRDDPISAYKIIQKYTYRKSYTECLGLQNAIEKDLEKVLWGLKINKDRVVLCVDDIDRCSTEKMIGIVDSLRTVLENDKIRKRLIVICSIDIEKLMNGYKVLYHNENIDSNTNNVRGQIDKLFIFCIGLPELDSSQLSEYLMKLVYFKELGDATSGLTKYSHRTNANLYPNPSHITTSILLSSRIIHDTIMFFLDKNKDIKITPRKLRIIYYQLLFANNLAAIREIEFTEDLIEDLLNKSLTGKKIDYSHPIWGDIIETAVPY